MDVFPDMHFHLTYESLSLLFLVVLPEYYKRKPSIYPEYPLLYVTLFDGDYFRFAVTVVFSNKTQVIVFKLSNKTFPINQLLLPAITDCIQFSLTGAQILPYVSEFAVKNNFEHSDIFNDTALHTFHTSTLSKIEPELWTDNVEPKYDTDVEIIQKDSHG